MRMISAIFLALMMAPAAAQDFPAPGTAWSKPWFVRVEAGFSNADFHARWDINRCACGDLYIEAEETLPEAIRTGEQLLLDGNVLLVKGYEGYDGPVAALLDSPVLMMQLVFTLLQKAEPSGPASITQSTETFASEKSEPILLDTGYAFGGFPAPWEMRGNLAPLIGQKVAFDLNFSFTLPDTSRESIRLSGKLEYQETPFPIGNTTPLDGWSAAWLDMQTENREGLTPGITLGEFRKLRGGGN